MLVFVFTDWSGRRWSVLNPEFSSPGSARRNNFIKIYINVSGQDVALSSFWGSCCQHGSRTAQQQLACLMFSCDLIGSELQSTTSCRDKVYQSHERSGRPLHSSGVFDVCLHETINNSEQPMRQRSRPSIGQSRVYQGSDRRENSGNIDFGRRLMVFWRPGNDEVVWYLWPTIDQINILQTFIWKTLFSGCFSSKTSLHCWF